ncbi:MAG: hypothetical protein MI975_12280 [Cytophagales bacterium]|nr:hypothetical protein [Cytophagales bacterium]
MPTRRFHTSSGAKPHPLDGLVRGNELPLLDISDFLSKFMALFDCKSNDGIWSVLIPYINRGNVSHYTIDVMRIFEYNSLYSLKNL